jgi:hypothetical protein
MVWCFADSYKDKSEMVGMGNFHYWHIARLNERKEINLSI